MTDAPEQLEQVKEAISEALGDAYDCTRVWSAWSHGTMTDDDFTPVSDDNDRLSEIASAAINAINPRSDIAPKVKPLVWEFIQTPPSGEHCARSVLGGWFIVVGHQSVFVTGPCGFKATCENLDGAKAAAQAHHDALIRSAIVTQGEE